MLLPIIKKEILVRASAPTILIGYGLICPTRDDALEMAQLLARYGSRLQFSLALETYFDSSCYYREGIAVDMFEAVEPIDAGYGDEGGRMYVVTPRMMTHVEEEEFVQPLLFDQFVVPLTEEMARYAFIDCVILGWGDPLGSGEKVCWYDS